MKTIPVSLLGALFLLPVRGLAETPAPPPGKPPGEEGKRGGPMRAFAEAWKNADTNSDGFITRGEMDVMPRIQKLPEEKRANLFKRLDKDADGKISREEIAMMAKHREGQGPPMRRLWELDTDKSGGVSLVEFKAGELNMKLPPDAQDELFKRLDTDSDGQITPKDRPEPPFKRRDGKGGKRGEGPPHDPREMMREADKNADGSISFEEFRVTPPVAGLTEDEQEDKFEALDKNGDLKLSPEDLPPPPAPVREDPKMD